MRARIADLGRSMALDQSPQESTMCCGGSRRGPQRDPRLLDDRAQRASATRPPFEHSEQADSNLVRDVLGGLAGEINVPFDCVISREQAAYGNVKACIYRGVEHGVCR